MIIVSPLPILSITAGAENLLTPSPKEVWAPAAASPVVLDIDFGSAVEFDTIFLGYTNATVGSQIAVVADPAGANVEIFAQQVVRAADAITSRPHLLVQLPASVTRRYVRVLVYQGGGQAFVAGIMLVGLRFQAGHERGAGRQIIDTGSKERLPDGGIAGEDGVLLTSLRWRFIGLSDAMRRRLWNLAWGRGERRPVLVVEEPDSELLGANERIHYGTFDRFDSYERQNPDDTAWGLSMTEWV
jgi:hypothetical protein